nr:hypothetical protein [Anaerolineae bacterium]
MPTDHMHPVRRITMHRVEEKVEDVSCESWQAADEILRRWAHTAPDEGYEKIHFHITWTDGAGYSGRFDLQSKHRLEENLLNRQINHHLSVTSGLYQPRWMGDLVRKQLLDMYSEEEQQGAHLLLLTHDLGEVPILITGEHVPEAAAWDLPGVKR